MKFFFHLRVRQRNNAEIDFESYLKDALGLFLLLTVGHDFILEVHFNLYLPDDCPKIKGRVDLPNMKLSCDVESISVRYCLAHV